MRRLDQKLTVGALSEARIQGCQPQASSKPVTVLPDECQGVLHHKFQHSVAACLRTLSSRNQHSHQDTLYSIQPVPLKEFRPGLQLLLPPEILALLLITHICRLQKRPEWTRPAAAACFCGWALSQQSGGHFKAEGFGCWSGQCYRCQ